MKNQPDALAKRRFSPRENGTCTLVPLLVCSDDMEDFRAVLEGVDHLLKEHAGP